MLQETKIRRQNRHHLRYALARLGSPRHISKFEWQWKWKYISVAGFIAMLVADCVNGALHGNVLRQAWKRSHLKTIDYYFGLKTTARDTICIFKLILFHINFALLFYRLIAVWFTKTYSKYCDFLQLICFFTKCIFRFSLYFYNKSLVLALEYDFLFIVFTYQLI